MRILVVGSGGREHAIAWRLAQDPEVDTVYVAPGNAGTAGEPKCINVPLAQSDELASFAEQNNVDFTIVGPEAPLVNGIVDCFYLRGLRIFGPTQAAAQLEGSKKFAKQFMMRHNIPTAKFQVFTDSVAAHAHIDAEGVPIVIKADGLAAGKGVVVAMTLGEAHAAVDMMLEQNKFGEAGATVVIEEFLEGEEVSFIALVDGYHALALATSQDHKRLLDDDQGPNTGGMGAYSPAPIVTPEMHDHIMREVIMPTISGMAAEGIDYMGFLYAGLMIQSDGSVKVLEFNCRMGDPETQPIMMRLWGDFAGLVDAAIDGQLDEVTVDWNPRPALGVVMAAENYPGAPRTGDVIYGLNRAAQFSDTLVFHAGTANRDGEVVTSGGRVLCVTALGDDVEAAQKRAYGVLAAMSFDGMQCRRDIGTRALKEWRRLR
jgi:phosphoribosylamine--glycine ligase